MWRLRSQIAMHSNKRAVLRRGGGTLRPYKLQLLPFFFRHHLAVASADGHVGVEGMPALTHTFDNTAVMHLCVDKCAPAAPLDPSALAVAALVPAGTSLSEDMMLLCCAVLCWQAGGVRGRQYPESRRMPSCSGPAAAAPPSDCVGKCGLTEWVTVRACYSTELLTFVYIRTIIL